MRQRQTCSGCGTRPDEWDPQEGGGLDAYAAEPQLCFGCAAVEIQQKAIPENAPGGIHIVLKRKGAPGGTR